MALVPCKPIFYLIICLSSSLSTQSHGQKPCKKNHSYMITVLIIFSSYLRTIFTSFLESFFCKISRLQTNMVNVTLVLSNSLLLLLVF